MGSEMCIRDSGWGWWVAHGCPKKLRRPTLDARCDTNFNRMLLRYVCYSGTWPPTWQTCPTVSLHTAACGMVCHAQTHTHTRTRVEAWWSGWIELSLITAWVAIWCSAGAAKHNPYVSRSCRIPQTLSLHCRCMVATRLRPSYVCYSGTWPPAWPKVRK